MHNLDWKKIDQVEEVDQQVAPGKRKKKLLVA
jgi:hypothetical protein